ncbi:GGDEF domain-containing protein [Shewanella gelidii]|uniref:GGDEF domain-containing protein n=1 Tax=Shewanella gelidii TaxID=1642821 RepID=A0A917N9F2_9GAMM|nr:GGDEF domain-containing protein [Shewanella gelidii]MCL1097576.1 GGDEF domain-containing protein [Shewanella gelidii]GGI80511.1 hypothetical protein GCM10009332_17310 [Shewanella gelidii]
MNLLAMLLTFSGLIGLLFAIKPSYKICTLPEYRNSGWYLLFVMILFFIFGYLGFLWLLFKQSTGNYELVVAAIFAGGGMFVYAVTKMSKKTILSLQDIVKEKHYQSRHDMLTQLPNRTLFYEKADQLISQKVAKFSCLMLDLNDFKIINDTFGHARGDEVLQILAQRLMQTVPSEATPARIGGDELAVLLPKASAQEAFEIARSIQHAFKEDIECKDYKLGIGVSIGIVEYPDHGESKETLLKNADTAMYQAKYNDNNCQVFHKFL